MDNLNDLKAIWLTAKTESLPDSNEMMQLIGRYRNQKLVRKLALILAMLALIAIMVEVIVNYKSAMLSTRIGEICIIISALVLISANIPSVKRFYLLKDCSNKDFALFLEQSRSGRIRYYERTQIVGLAFNAAGILFYLFELVHNNKVWCVIAYALTVVYLLVLGLVVRPRVYKRQMKRLNERIEKAQKIMKQF
jgi:hypothetical protein